MIKAKNILIFGAGGHAKVVIDAIEKSNAPARILIIDDNSSLWGSKMFGYQVLGNLEMLLKERAKHAIDYFIVAIGNNRLRSKTFSTLKAHDIYPGSVIHPSAVLSKGVLIGNGTVLFANTVINADSRIGDNVIINTAATIDHDCLIGDGVHVAPGVNVCGGVTIGEETLVGAGSVIIPGIKVGKNVTIGAGSIVLKDIQDNMKVAGVPAREI